MSQLKVGDVVWLKSGGGFKMTISNIENDIYTCQWFDNKKQLQTEDFGINVLTTKDPDKPPLPY